jgi:hypothetical protein
VDSDPHESALVLLPGFRITGKHNRDYENARWAVAISGTAGTLPQRPGPLMNIRIGKGGRYKPSRNRRATKDVGGAGNESTELKRLPGG